jgi:hypothetical protein
MTMSVRIVEEIIPTHHRSCNTPHYLRSGIRIPHDRHYPSHDDYNCHRFWPYPLHRANHNCLIYRSLTVSFAGCSSLGVHSPDREGRTYRDAPHQLGHRLPLRSRRPKGKFTPALQFLYGAATIAQVTISLHLCNRYVIFSAGSTG